MVCDNPENEQHYRVIVDAIVGGPFDLQWDQTVSESDLEAWKEQLLRLGAIEPVEDLTQE